MKAVQSMKNIVLAALFLSLLNCSPVPASAAAALPTSQQIDAQVQRVMKDTGAQGLALAVIDKGQVSKVSVYGYRDAQMAPLTTSSIMYAASLTKMAFAYMVMQLVEEGILDLDRSIADYLPRPLTDYGSDEIEDRYARWSDLAGDERWRTLTPRILLTHSSGFANFGFLEPDGKLRIHFEPGSQYSYSGDGFILLQFVLEEGLGLDVGTEMQRRLFQPLGISDTGMMWRDDFAGRTADGWTIDGDPVPHDERSMTRAAGSMDTSITDMAKLSAAIVRGDFLSAQARQEFVRPQLHIGTASQFPTLQDNLPIEQQRADLAAALGIVVFDGPQGPGFYKSGHDEITGNMLTCIESSQRCVLILGNDLRAEAAIPFLVDFILGPAGVPWGWNYGDLKLWATER